VHRCGDENALGRNIGIDPTINARVLWLASHPLRGPEDQESRSSQHAL
jgi:hypothetical protein